MPQNDNQQPNMTLEQANEAKALLGIATRISEGMMPQTPQEAPVSPETAPEQEETPEVEEDIIPEENEAPEADLEAKFDEFKEEIKSLIKDELKGLKKENGETE